LSFGTADAGAVCYLPGIQANNRKPTDFWDPVFPWYADFAEGEQMGMKTTTDVEISRPLSEVFRYTLENVADWSITVVEDEVIEETPEHVGTTFRIVTEDRGRRMEMNGEVTRYELDRLSEIHLTSTAFDIDALYEFEDLGGGRTRVTESAEVHPKGITKVFFFSSAGE